MSTGLLSCGTSVVYYMHLIGISKDRRGSLKSLKKYDRKYSKFDGNKKAQMFQSTINRKKNNIKLHKTSKKGNLKIKEKKHITYKRRKIKMSPHFPPETV